MLFATNPQPKIDEYLSTDKDRFDGAVVIFPGGGYRRHAEHEGKGYAEFLLKHGISSFVVFYRTTTEKATHPDMLEDALYSIQYAKDVCAKNGLNPDKVGVMGSSAGGHLAAQAISAWQDYDKSLRPAFGILCYPVIDYVSKYAHKYSKGELLGENYSDELIYKISAQNMVHSQTSPVFLWHTGEDKTVPMEHSLMMIEALRKNNVPSEIHLYDKGDHGEGLRSQNPWAEALINWILKK